MTGLENDLQSQAQRIAEDGMQSTIKKLQEGCTILEMKVENQENRGHRNT